TGKAQASVLDIVAGGTVNLSGQVDNNGNLSVTSVDGASQMLGRIVNQRVEGGLWSNGVARTSGTWYAIPPADASSHFFAAAKLTIVRILHPEAALQLVAFDLVSPNSTPVASLAVPASAATALAQALTDVSTDRYSRLFVLFGNQTAA